VWGADKPQQGIKAAVLCRSPSHPAHQDCASSDVALVPPQATVGVLTAWKMANTMNPGFFYPSFLREWVVSHLLAHHWL